MFRMSHEVYSLLFTIVKHYQDYPNHGLIPALEKYKLSADVKVTTKCIIDSIIRDLKNGMPFHESIDQFPEMFPPYIRALFKTQSPDRGIVQISMEIMLFYILNGDSLRIKKLPGTLTIICYVTITMIFVITDALGITFHIGLLWAIFGSIYLFGGWHARFSRIIFKILNRIPMDYQIKTPLIGTLLKKEYNFRFFTTVSLLFYVKLDSAQILDIMSLVWEDSNVLNTILINAKNHLEPNGNIREVLMAINKADSQSILTPTIEALVSKTDSKPDIWT